MTPGVVDIPEGQLGPLDPEHFVQLRQAHRRARTLRRAERFAGFSGWTTFSIGLCALPFALGDGTALAIGIALVAVGYHELALRRRLRMLDRGAPAALAVNQLIMAAAIIAYAAWHLLDALGPGIIGPATASAAPAVAGDPQVDELLAGAGMPSMASMTRMLEVGLYASLIAGTIVFQGLAARYYHSRRKHMSAFLAETPGWVITLHRAGVMA